MKKHKDKAKDMKNGKVREDNHAMTADVLDKMKGKMKPKKMKKDRADAGY
jgi:hypothetical protein